MSRAVKLFGIVLLAGVMIATMVAVAIGELTSRPSGTATARPPDRSMRVAALNRCRAVTSLAAACEAAWDTERRRFFGKAGR